MRLVLSLAIAAVFSSEVASQGPASHPLVSQAQYRRLAKGLVELGPLGPR